MEDTMRLVDTLTAGLKSEHGDKEEQCLPHAAKKM